MKAGDWHSPLPARHPAPASLAGVAPWRGARCPVRYSAGGQPTAAWNWRAKRLRECHIGWPAMLLFSGARDDRAWPSCRWRGCVGRSSRHAADMRWLTSAWRNSCTIRTSHRRLSTSFCPSPPCWPRRTAVQDARHGQQWRSGTCRQAGRLLSIASPSPARCTAAHSSWLCRRPPQSMRYAGGDRESAWVHGCAAACRLRREGCRPSRTRWKWRSSRLRGKWLLPQNPPGRRYRLKIQSAAAGQTSDPWK